MKPGAINHDPAFPVMAMDIVSNVLSRADNPGDLATYLTEEIRDLTGARCVLLIQWLGNATVAEYRVVGLNPLRRREWAESPEVSRLYEVVQRIPAARFWRGEEPAEVAGLLRREGFELSMAFPLNAGAFRVGAMLVLGLPDEKHISSVLDLLNNLSAIVALVLRNSFLFERQEETIQERTAELQIELTERKRAEEALRKSEAKYMDLYENAPDMYASVNARTALIEQCNSTLSSTLGYSKEEIIGRPVFEIYHPDCLEEVQKAFKSFRDTGEVHDKELQLRRKDGSRLDVSLNVLSVRDEEGNILYSRSTLRDITERKQAEEALRESERKYRTIVEHAPFGITRSTKDGKLVSVNPALAAILKYDSAEELQETINRSSIQDVLFPEPSERVPLVENILSSDSWHVFNNRLRCKDGSIVTCRVHSRRIVDEAGRTNEFESFQENITDQVEAEQALRESEEKFRVLAKTSPAAICLYQGEGLIYANPAMERLFGYSADELCRMKFWEWAREDFKELIRERGLARLRGEAVPGQYEASYITKTGDERVMLVSAGVMEYRGRATGVASFLDITERKRTVELIRASLREKEVLLKEIHHRVKNNLQVVSGLLFLQAQKIQDPDLAAHFVESQNRIYSMALAHEQLYQSKNLADVRLPEYVESLVEEIEQVFRSGEKKVCCRVDVDDIDLDIERVVPCGLLITELLSNALQHAFPGSRAGTVRVEIRRENDLLSLTVRDDGVGLPADLDVSSAGTLGLQLVRALTDQLDGTLELVRREGAEFRVTFPYRSRQEGVD